MMIRFILIFLFISALGGCGKKEEEQQTKKTGDEIIATIHDKSISKNQFDAYLKRRSFHGAFVKLVLACRDRLTALYAQTGLSDADRRRAKAADFERLRSEYRQLKTQWNGYSGYDWWFSRPLNNARLLTVSTYHDHVAAFRSLFRSVNGDWQRFYDACRALADAPAGERRERLDWRAESTGRLRLLVENWDPCQLNR